MQGRKKADPQFRAALSEQLARAIEDSELSVEELAKKIGLTPGGLYHLLDKDRHDVPRSDYLFAAMRELKFGFRFAGLTMRLDSKPSKRESRKASGTHEVQLQLFCNAPTLKVKIPATVKRSNVRVLVQLSDARRVS